jgi:hypothetical protein
MHPRAWILGCLRARARVAPSGVSPDTVRLSSILVAVGGT